MEGLMYHTFPALRKRGWRTLAASILFWMPLVREIVLWTGCVDASRPTAQYQLRKGRSIVVIPGGEAEQLCTAFGQDNVTLRNRMGFIALAVESGAPLVPCYVFGCTDLYYTFQTFFSFRETIRKTLRICLPLFIGDFGVAPRKNHITIAVGEPIFVKKVPRPTGSFASEPQKAELFRAAVADAHAKYITGLHKVFEERKHELGYGDRKLSVE